MSTELTTITQAEMDDLAALMGATPESGDGDFLPVLKINYDSEDDDGNQLPLGHWVVTGQDVDVYAKKVSIRPVAMHYQYLHFDADENKMVNQTVLNTSFRQEFLDEKGTQRCGRPDSRTMKDMSDERKKMYSDISCIRQVRCLVSYEGKDKEGNKHTVENVPVLLRLRGANFMPFDDEFVRRLPKGRKMWDFWTEVSLKREKKGSVTYYVASFDPDLNNPVPMDRDTIDTIKYFSELIEKENAVIYEKHKAALSARSQDQGVYDAIADEAGLDSEFEMDEIPF